MLKPNGILRRSLLVLLCSTSPVWGQARTEAELLEERAAEQQAAEQQVALRAIPLVSGFHFHQLDPESPASASVIVFNEGTFVLMDGALTGDPQGGYAFQGRRASGGETWIDQPLNRILLLAIFKWIAISAVVGWPFVAFVLRGTMFEDDRLEPTTGSKFFRFCGWVANLLVLVVMLVVYLLAIRRPALWPGARNLQIEHLHPLVWALAGSLALGLLGSGIAWSKSYWRWPSRFHYTITILSGLGFVWYLYRCEVLQTVLGKFLG